MNKVIFGFIIMALVFSENIYSAEIHPRVFSQVPCWLSDNGIPEVTEINLTAVKKNVNKYNYSEIQESDGWVKWISDESNYSYAYKVVEKMNKLYKIKYVENFGGSSSFIYEIGYSLEDREITIEGKKDIIQVIRIQSIKCLPH